MKRIVILLTVWVALYLAIVSLTVFSENRVNEVLLSLLSFSLLVIFILFLRTLIHYNLSFGHKVKFGFPNLWRLAFILVTIGVHWKKRLEYGFFENPIFGSFFGLFFLLLLLSSFLNFKTKLR